MVPPHRLQSEVQGQGRSPRHSPRRTPGAPDASVIRNGTAECAGSKRRRLFEGFNLLRETRGLPRESLQREGSPGQTPLSSSGLLYVPFLFPAACRVPSAAGKGSALLAPRKVSYRFKDTGLRHETPGPLVTPAISVYQGVTCHQTPSPVPSGPCWGQVTARWLHCGQKSTLGNAGLGCWASSPPTGVPVGAGGLGDGAGPWPRGPQEQEVSSLGPPPCSSGVTLDEGQGLTGSVLPS